MKLDAFLLAHRPGMIVFAIPFLLACQACSLMPKKEFKPVDPETLIEWSVEGKVEIDTAAARNEAHFLFESIDGDLRLVIHPHSPVDSEGAELLVPQQVAHEQGKLSSNDVESRHFLQQLTAMVPLENLNYWLRALPATAEADVALIDGDQVASIQEQGWRVSYDSYMQVEQYALPDEIRMVGKAGEVHMELVRAETGRLTSPCAADPGRDPVTEQTDPHQDSRHVLESLVPSDRSAPLPRWIDHQDFCRQLIKVHGKVPDARVGLYGPGSMMWRLAGPLAPGGMGAGRALLLQTAHPWITAGIDEHSIVRYDPVERARRTAVNVSTMVFGSMPQVMRSAHRVHKTHEEIKGKIPHPAGAFAQGSEYRANEVNAMIWVHATLWDTLVMMYEELEGPLTHSEKDRFYEETKLFAMLFGIPENALPKDWNDFMAYNQAMWNSAQLTVTANAVTLKEDLFTPRSVFLIFPLWIQEMVTSAHLPARVREGYGMDYGTWEKFNNAWLMASAKFVQWILPDVLGVNAIKHEAEARLKGERVSAYHQMLIERFLETERLVN